MLAFQSPASALANAARTRAHVAAVVVAALCLGGIASAFWFEDLRYARPAHKPAEHVDVALGATVGIAPEVEELFGERDASRPLLLHFYNPDCPCSRFNVPYLRELVEQHRERVDFALVVECVDEAQVERARAKVEADLPWVFDRDGAIADRYGVYATPLAVIVAPDGRLVFRGNYASARYCTDPAKQAARLALEGLLEVLEDGRTPLAPLEEILPYGCSLPSDRLAP
jgi:hypothetical protein